MQQFTIDDGDSDGVLLMPPEAEVPGGGGGAAADAATSGAATPARPATATDAEGKPLVTIGEALQAIDVNAKMIAEAEDQLQRLMSKQRSLVQAERVLEQDLVASVLPDRSLGFDNGRPVAAILLTRCLQHWGALGALTVPEQHAAVLLHRYVHLIAQLLRAEEEPAPAGVPERLRPSTAYWLSVSSVLLALVRQGEKRRAAAAAGGGPPGGAAGDAAARSQVRRGMANLQKKLTGGVEGLHIGARLGDGFQELKQLLRAPGRGGKAAAGDGTAQLLPDLPSDEAAAPEGASGEAAAAAAAGPAPLESAGGAEGGAASASAGVAPPGEPLPGSEIVEGFIASLDHVAQRAFLALRDQLRRALLPLLANCLQHTGGGEDGGGAAAAAPPKEAPAGDSKSAATASQDGLDPYREWAEIVAVLHDATRTLGEQCVPGPLVRALLEQVLAFIDAQLFNQLLLRPELCSTRNARAALRGLKQIDALLLALGLGAGQDVGDKAWCALNATRQALQFLALEHKGELTLEDIAQELCPALTGQQLYRLCTTAWDDGPAAGRVSGEVLEAMHAQHQVECGPGGPESSLTNQGLMVTCLLDEPSQPPFVSGPPGAGRSSPDAVATWLDGRDYGEGVSVPPQLLSSGCPPQVFAFLQDPAVTWPFF